RTVNLVDHHDDTVAQLQRLGEDEAGLGHGALGSVHQQDDAVDHLQNALDFAAEVRVARGVDHVDLHIFIANGSVFGQNRDAALPLQVAGVHDTVHNLLVFPVGAALLEHFIDQSGFAVVNVGNDGYVSQLLVLHKL